MMRIGTTFGGIRIPPSLDGVIVGRDGDRPDAWRLTSNITGASATVRTAYAGQGQMKPYRLFIEGRRTRSFGWRHAAIEAAIEALLAGHRAAGETNEREGGNV
ncbi:hypothetical protein [Microbacterium halotolerans]|uniref:hypothetical protein n=1 Tax=Microbacterium halotolerans TaxID=246613 RepID=UPI000E6AAE13|nr:hypothetical protein [Microbacterium halotolerans]